MKCVESGRDVFEPGYDCIIDEGEAVSWAWINEQIEKQDKEAGRKQKLAKKKSV